MAAPQPIVTPHLEAVVEVDAAPEAVWAVVSDVTRTAEWSPVVWRSEWIGEPDGAAVGARFVGHNRFNGFRWSRECVVTEAEPGAVFAFSTFGKARDTSREQTRWRYRIEPDGAGSRVTLAYEIVTYPRWVVAARAVPGMRARNERQARWNLDESLRRLGELLEPV